jgi:hypothetical protein
VPFPALEFGVKALGTEDRIPLFVFATNRGRGAASAAAPEIAPEVPLTINLSLS